MSISSLIQHIWFLGVLEMKSMLYVLYYQHIMETDDRALLRKGGQLINKKKEMDWQLLVRIANYTMNSK